MAKETLRMRVNTRLPSLGVLKARHVLTEEQYSALDKPTITDLIKSGLAEKHKPSETVSGTLTGVTNADGDVVPLDKMKVEELKALAADMEIEGHANMNKGELVEAIQAVEVETDEEGGDKS